MQSSDDDSSQTHLPSSTPSFHMWYQRSQFQSILSAQPRCSPYAHKCCWWQCSSGIFKKWWTPAAASIWVENSPTQIVTSV
jgi:hypothetical protein